MNQHSRPFRSPAGLSQCSAFSLTVLSAVLLTSGFAQPSSLPANGADKDEVINLDKYVVSTDENEGYGAQRAAIGSRTVKPLIDVPSSVYVVSRELINDLGATYSSQALKYVSPGTTTSDTSGDGANIRGFSAGSLRDGVRLLWYKHLPMYDVERIEVVKGPANMLIGGDTSFSGGVMNFVTRRPTQEFRSDAKVTVGTDSYFRGEANVSGPIVKSDDFTALYRVTLGGETGDPEKPMNTVDEKFIGGALAFNFGSRIRLDLNFYHFEDNTNDYWSDFLDIVRSVPNGPAVLNPNSTSTFAPGRPDQNFWDTKSWVLNAGLTASLTQNGTFRLFYAHMDGTDRRRTLRGGTVQADNYTLTRQDILFDLRRYTKTLQADYLYQTKRETWGNDLQVGAEVGQTFDGTNNNLLTAPPLDTRNPDYNSYQVPNPTDWNSQYFNVARNTQKTDVGSYWFQDNLTLFREKLILVGGLRWSDKHYVSEQGNQIILPGNATPAYNKTIKDDPMLRTHRYGIVYKPFPELSLYFSDAENQTPTPGFDSFGVPFKDSSGTLQEYGIKFGRSSGRYRFFGNVAYFEMLQTNIRTSIPDSTVPGGIRYFQTESDSTEGWETELGGRITNDTGYVELVGTYYDVSTYRAADRGRAVGAPDRTYSLLAKYSWTSGSLKGLTLGAGVYDQTVVRTGNNNTIDYPVTYSAMARYIFAEKWAVQLNGMNITDERYISNVINTGLVQVAPRAEYRLSVKYTW
ncbi:MAG TPA: TonB-dependent receptor plug domain-containing protein [Opitutaceae bacterium]|nr:TonB-dependent receptor plug domain-containing protein [Opitutaceae bacterium]